jgi:hypothetical protein
MFLDRIMVVHRCTTAPAEAATVEAVAVATDDKKKRSARDAERFL